MSDAADVVVVGGGVVGVSIACHLAMRGASVVLCERTVHLGGGSTAKGAGGIRAQFSEPDHVRFSLDSIAAFEHFEERYGSPLLFDQCGYMFLATTPEHVDHFMKTMPMQRSLGVDMRWMDADEIRSWLPHLRGDDVAGGTFGARDGLADPHEVTQGFASAARRHGARIILDCEVTGIDFDSGRVKGVRSSRGSFSTDVAVDAAGPWAKSVGAMAGVDVPVSPVKRQIAVTAPIEWIPRHWPMVIDTGSGLYCHRESGGLLLGWADPSTGASEDESVDAGYTDEIISRALDRIPRLEEAGLANAWAGLYETTPDHRAIIGRVPEVEGFVVVAGFSGHGFMHAPATGEQVARLILDGRTSIDLSSFSIERFKLGALSPELNVI